MDEAVRYHLLAGRRREAFEIVVQSLQQKVFRLACSILHDEALAEEATQDAFLRAWRALVYFKGDSSVSTWIYSIARNVCLTRAKQRDLERKLVPGRSREPAAGGQSPHAGIDLELALSRLPERYRHVLKLFYYEEKSYENVAEMLDIPVGTVKTHLHRARKELRRILEDQKAGDLYEVRRV